MTEILNNCKDLAQKLDELLYYNQEELDRLDSEDKINEGIKIGKEEKCFEIAKNMLKKKIDVAVISECTNLSIEEIEKLK